MSNVLMDISLHADTQHRALDLSTPQNLPYLKQSLGEIPGEDCRLLSTIRCEWWNRVTGFAILVLYSILCSQWSASGKPWSATDDAAEATDDIFTFLLNQEHGVNNKRSQSIQSVLHSKRTYRMWPHQKDRSTREKKKRKKRKKCFSRIARSWQSSIV